MYDVTISKLETDKDGKPVKGAIIKVFNNDGASYDFGNGAGYTLAVYTDKDDEMSITMVEDINSNDVSYC